MFCGIIFYSLPSFISILFHADLTVTTFPSWFLICFLVCFAGGGKVGPDGVLSLWRPPFFFNSLKKLKYFFFFFWRAWAGQPAFGPPQPAFFRIFFGFRQASPLFDPPARQPTSPPGRGVFFGPIFKNGSGRTGLF